MAKPDPAAIKRAMQAILAPGQVTELRALDVTAPDYRRPHTVSGYFDGDHLDQLAQAAASLTAKAIYFVPNPIKPALLARAANRARPIDGKEPTTSDGDIEQRHWLLIDADPIRPAGISSTDAEHDAALALATGIREWLTIAGWPLPILADSGNGAHLLYRVDLPRDDGGLMARLLLALAARFDTKAVGVDGKTFNPARLWKLYGTVARKGDDTPDRPHRLAVMLEVPPTLAAVDKSLLLALAGPAAEPSETTYQGNGKPFDLAAWMAEHGLVVNHEGPWNNGGYRWILKVCPWEPSHTNLSAFIVRHSDGVIGAGCQHNSCSGKGWRSLRDLLEPGWRDKRHGDGPSRASLLQTIENQKREIASLRQEIARLKRPAFAPPPAQPARDPLAPTTRPLIALRGIEI